MATPEIQHNNQVINVKDLKHKGNRHSFIVSLFLRLIKEKPLGVIGGIIVFLLFFAGVFANYLAPYGYNDMYMQFRLDPPSAQHILGVDDLGRDLLSRVIYGARISMYVGIGGTLIATFCSTLIGVVSGYLGGKFDTITQRFVDAFMSFPPLFFYLTLMSVIGPGILQVIVVLGLVSGIRESRVMRSAALAIRGNVYFDAANSIGARPWVIILRHMIPNLISTIIILTTIRMGNVIIAESTLSFLGYGIPPPTPSWGGMLSGSGRVYLIRAPWLAIWPGLALTLAVWGINMLGDAIRDLLDPKLRGGVGRYGGKRARTGRIVIDGGESKGI